jgi:hypothetical protein
MSEMTWAQIVVSQRESELREHRRLGLLDLIVLPLFCLLLGGLFAWRVVVGLVTLLHDLLRHSNKDTAG